MAILDVSGSRLLWQRAPWQAPPPQEWSYQLATAIQLDGQTAGVLAGLRVGNTPSVDFCAGTDLFPVRDWEWAQAVAPTAVRRGPEAPYPGCEQPGMFSSFPVRGGFVPLGARCCDGRAHPHAGTGFGILREHLYPPAEIKATHTEREPERRLGVQQYRWDGERFHAEEPEFFAAGEVDHIQGWCVDRHCMSTAIPDGQDLLSTLRAHRPGDDFLERGVEGLARWRCCDGGWRLVDFTPVTEPGAAFEASLIRDLDGSLLLAARPWKHPHAMRPGHYPSPEHHSWLWRSRDGWRWEQIMDLPYARSSTPITLNQAADGTPFILLNPYVERTSKGGRGKSISYRETLQAVPLSADRRRLLDPIAVLDGNQAFGQPSGDALWNISLATAQTLRTADGRWRCMAFYRVIHHTENHSAATGLTPQSGTWVSEIVSDGAVVPQWGFEAAVVAD